MQVYKFSSSATDTAPTITEQQLIDQLKTGERYVFGTDNMVRDGVFRLSGWAFDIRNSLKKFVYKQYGSWSEAYAPDRTTLRKLTYGRIDQIIEA